MSESTETNRMRSCATICLVPSIHAGPWIYWHDLAASCQKAADLGFDAIELFADHDFYERRDELAGLLEKHNLQLAAVGTGAGKVLHGWHLTHEDANVRAKAVEYITRVIEFGGTFGAPAILGSMQGFVDKEIGKDKSRERFAEGLRQLDAAADQHGVSFIYEPLNRYESDLINGLGPAFDFLGEIGTKRVVLLADLFHMNIEEVSLGESIRQYGSRIGHVHFADSNRRPAGMGHTNWAEVGEALRAIDYRGFVSAEAFPYPDPDAAAKQTIDSFRSVCATSG